MILYNKTAVFATDYRRFLDGFFGKDTEYREVELLGFSREQVVFQVGNQFMETKVDFMNLVSVETAL